MKRLITASLSVMLLFIATVNPAQAQSRHEKMLDASQTLQNSSPVQLTPFRLVYLAYQGYLKNQGIPSYGTFISASHQMNVHGKNLVEAGIKANLLPAATLSNQEYINSVDTQLLGLSSKS
ncbi:hypothetical protein [Calothrix sp. PCC 6303]|uniref:hypothetical protein n=1 Tax=Calothrix sp. PCC 6303 TaxID=1170562 RepID=UPI0002A02153|nr:hypothetical protein [Calothrix sp. PCC 6303]AFY99755.1 hypothetical protein Cal6303_0684 [Calothrix sp. PCC 6303]